MTILTTKLHGRTYEQKMADAIREEVMDYSEGDPLEIDFLAEHFRLSTKVTESLIRSEHWSLRFAMEMCEALELKIRIQVV